MFIQLVRGAFINKTQMRLMLMSVIFVLGAMQSFAQSTIEFDTDELITQSNSWITTFLPILAIPFGISIALALITLVGGLIVGALRNVKMSR